MTYTTSTLKGTVPIADFDRGFAGKIFADVRQNGAKMVMRGDTAECVLLSPEEYDRIVEKLEDAQLLAIAEERLSRYDPAKTISWEEMNRRLGITEEDLANCEEVELE